MKQLTARGFGLAYSGDVPEGTAHLAGTGLAADAHQSILITRLEQALEQQARIGEELSAALRALTGRAVPPTEIGLDLGSSASASDSATLNSDSPASTGESATSPSHSATLTGDSAPLTLTSESPASTGPSARLASPNTMLTSHTATLSLTSESPKPISESPATSISEYSTSTSECPTSTSECAAMVRCLGALEVQIGGVPIQSWRSGKARAVFEYLVTHRPRPVPRETLIQALWPDPDALASGTSLKVAVHALRQIFSASAENRLQPKLSVVVQESTYQIHAPGLWLDVEEFERFCSLGVQKEARGQQQDAMSLYRRAAELYRGDFLPESWDEWAIFRREGLKDQYLFVLAKLADAALQSADYDTCIRLCRQLLEQDCCREDTFRMLMVCHARLGQRGRVRRWYELCVLTLRSALDVEPEPETVRVYEWASGRAATSVEEAINPTLTVA